MLRLQATLRVPLLVALGCACVAVLTPSAQAALSAAASPAEVVSCVADNVPKGDDLRAITLISRDRGGIERTTHANVFGRRTPENWRHIVVRFTEPDDLIGSALLLVEDETGVKTWIRTPDVGLRQLVQGGNEQANLFRTGMSYEDFMRLLGFVRSEAKNQQLLADDLFDDRPVFVLESHPEPGTSAYARVVTSVDKETCVPLQIKLYERIGSPPRKIISADADEIFRVGDNWIAHSMVLRDYRDGKRTRLRLVSVFPPVELPTSVFDPEQLHRNPQIVFKVLEPMEVEPAAVE